MPGTRGEAIWEEIKAIALEAVQVNIDAEAASRAAADAATAADAAALTARVAALEASLAASVAMLYALILGLQGQGSLAQQAVTQERVCVADGGTAQMMDNGWVRLDDSDIRAELIERQAQAGEAARPDDSDLTAALV